MVRDERHSPYSQVTKVVPLHNIVRKSAPCLVADNLHAVRNPGRHLKPVTGLQCLVRAPID